MEKEAGTYSADTGDTSKRLNFEVKGDGEGIQLVKLFLYPCSAGVFPVSA